MKYFVTVRDRELEVEVDGDRVTVDGREVRAELHQVPGTPLRRLTVGGRTVQWPVDRRGTGGWVVAPYGEAWEVEVLDERTRHIRGLAGAGRGQTADRSLRAPMPGLVVRVEVEEGQAVTPGQGVVVLEAMKMENELRATSEGVVSAVRVAAGSTVEKGDVLVEYLEAGDA